MNRTREVRRLREVAISTTTYEQLKANYQDLKKLKQIKTKTFDGFLATIIEDYAREVRKVGYLGVKDLTSRVEALEQQLAETKELLSQQKDNSKPTKEQ